MLSLRLREYWATVSLLYWGAEAPEAPAAPEEDCARATFVCGPPAASRTRETKGPWSEADDATYLELLVRVGVPAVDNEGSVKAYLDAFPARAWRTIKKHSNTYKQTHLYEQWRRDNGGAWAGFAWRSRAVRAAEIRVDKALKAPPNAPGAKARAADAPAADAPATEAPAEDGDGSEAGEVTKQTRNQKKRKQRQQEDENARLEAENAWLKDAAAEAPAEDGDGSEAGEVAADEGADLLRFRHRSTVFVVHCSAATRGEVLSRRLFGTSGAHIHRLRDASHAVFLLYDLSAREVLGPFLAHNQRARMDIEPGAFGGRFRAQVRWTPHPNYAKHRAVRHKKILPEGVVPRDDALRLLATHWPLALKKKERKVLKHCKSKPEKFVKAIADVESGGPASSLRKRKRAAADAPPPKKAAREAPAAPRPGEPDDFEAPPALPDSGDSWAARAEPAEQPPAWWRAAAAVAEGQHRQVQAAMVERRVIGGWHAVPPAPPAPERPWQPPPPRPAWGGQGAGWTSDGPRGPDGRASPPAPPGGWPPGPTYRVWTPESDGRPPPRPPPPVPNAGTRARPARVWTPDHDARPPPPDGPSAGAPAPAPAFAFASPAPAPGGSTAEAARSWAIPRRVGDRILHEGARKRDTWNT
ncbi:hypothetical protein AURANDRAFT_65893 [Aureococcus anophagefferens]|uniref:DCD domain-containing protein n=1 Tax=Aureococcus anophagefferens TaxID=44056 RepID=F0YFD4_AURAN|nr:hypothetical protein AURANDRAFT_65893 [Aureococcus anophagefferens]EGB06170.1 hypothetical protein AURANDRAFT_65893 [Aureococcus anophagefferens]|eukprot:XP_009039122.1 hypothetical protein AURANDRAFT_65893 [Aureococcus anophagefferens]